MPPNYYKRKQDKLIDIDMTKFLVIVITVFVTFVIPVQFISLYKADPEEFNQVIANITNQKEGTTSTQPRVAGISNSTNSSSGEDGVMGIFGDFNLNNKSSQYFILGGFFLATSITIIFYLISTEKKPKKKHHYAKNKFDFYG